MVYFEAVLDCTASFMKILFIVFVRSYLYHFSTI